MHRKEPLKCMCLLGLTASGSLEGPQSNVDQASDLQTARSFQNTYVRSSSYLETSNKDVLVGRKLQEHRTPVSNTPHIALWRG
jgi:hypothetical protein